MAGNHPPVTDWATDFDHVDDAWSEDPYPIWEKLQQTCPVAHSNRYGGTWLPTTHEAVSAVAYDTENFTSKSIIVSEGRPMVDAPVGIAPPISSDPPFHHDARRLLLPAFSPKAVERLEPFTRSYCEGLLDELEQGALADGDVIDAAVDYAQHIPVRVIAEMLGFPPEDADRFREFIHVVLEGVDLPFEERLGRMGPLFEYLLAQIEDHRQNPRDDLTSYLLSCTLDGEPLTPIHVMGSIGLLLIAGIDTTWSAIGASLWHLAGHDDDRRRLAAEPELLITAMEEFLRAYAPVTMARLVAKDHDFMGCPMQVDEWVLLPFPAANRDPLIFEDPHTVKLDRAENRHAAFGLGIHRCVGSNLARMELRVALEVWMARFGDRFTLADADAVTWSHGQVRGPRTLPVRIS
jgi:cytochrome P450